MKTRKMVAILLTMTMVFSMIPGLAFADTTGSTTFVDMPNDWSTQALQNAVANGLINGYDGKAGKEIQPAGNLTRAEMATIVNRAFGATEKASLSGVGDVASSAWYADDMAKAVQMGTFKKDSSMRPNDKITRQEAFTVLARALKISDNENGVSKFNDGSSVASWAKGPVGGLASKGYVEGSNGNLNPTANITRAEFAKIMDNVIKQYVSGDVTSVAASGNVMVNKAGTTLTGTTVNGDLIIGDGVGNGTVTLDSTKVTGSLIVRGGGVNSIIIKGSSNIGTVIVAKVDGNVRVVVEDPAQVETIIINDGKDDVIIEGTVGTIQIESGTPVILRNADVKSISITAEGASLNVEKGSKVGTISVNKAASDVKISVAGTVGTIRSDAPNTAVSAVDSGKITTIEFAASADGSSVAIDKNATVNKIDTDADIKTSGEGKAKTITGDGKVNSSNTTGNKTSGGGGSSGGSLNGGGNGGGSTDTTNPIIASGNILSATEIAITLNKSKEITVADLTVKVNGTEKKGVAGECAAADEFCVNGSGTSYTIHLYTALTDGQKIEISGKGQLGEDSYTATYSKGAPVIKNAITTRDTQTSALVDFVSDKAGSFYFMVVASGSAVPSTDDVLAQLPYRGVTPTALGKTDMTVGDNTVSFNNLTTGAFDLYYVAEATGTGDKAYHSNVAKVVVSSSTQAALATGLTVTASYGKQLNYGETTVLIKNMLGVNTATYLKLFISKTTVEALDVRVGDSATTSFMALAVNNKFNTSTAEQTLTYKTTATGVFAVVLTDDNDKIQKAGLLTIQPEAVRAILSISTGAVTAAAWSWSDEDTTTAFNPPIGATSNAITLSAIDFSIKDSGRTMNFYSVFNDDGKIPTSGQYASLQLDFLTTFGAMTGQGLTWNNNNVSASGIKAVAEYDATLTTPGATKIKLQDDSMNALDIGRGNSLWISMTSGQAIPRIGDEVDADIFKDVSDSYDANYNSVNNIAYITTEALQAGTYILVISDGSNNVLSAGEVEIGEEDILCILNLTPGAIEHPINAYSLDDSATGKTVSMAAAQGGARTITLSAADNGKKIHLFEHPLGTGNAIPTSSHTAIVTLDFGSICSQTAVDLRWSNLSAGIADGLEVSAAFDPTVTTAGATHITIAGVSDSGVKLYLEKGNITERVGDTYVTSDAILLTAGAVNCNVTTAAGVASGTAVLADGAGTYKVIQINEDNTVMSAGSITITEDMIAGKLTITNVDASVAAISYDGGETASSTAISGGGSLIIPLGTETVIFYSTAPAVEGGAAPTEGLTKKYKIKWLNDFTCTLTYVIFDEHN